MKRFHVHVHVTDLAQNVGFYAKLFGVQPTLLEADYAKWMLDEPAVNFAISTRGHGHTGVDHVGIQVDNEADLQALKAQAQAADLSLLDEGPTTCCYARSDKHWIVDPQGLAWEHFQTLGQIPVFRAGEPTLAAPKASSPEVGQACCAPPRSGQVPATPTQTGCC